MHFFFTRNENLQLLKMYVFLKWKTKRERGLSGRTYFNLIIIIDSEIHKTDIKPYQTYSKG